MKNISEYSFSIAMVVFIISIVIIFCQIVYYKFDTILLNYIAKFLLTLLVLLSVVGLIYGMIEFNRKRTFKIFLGIVINIIPILFVIISFIIISSDIWEVVFGIKI